MHSPFDYNDLVPGLLTYRRRTTSFDDVEERLGISAIQLRNELAALSKLTKRLFGQATWPMQYKKEQGSYYYRMDKHGGAVVARQPEGSAVEAAEGEPPSEWEPHRLSAAMPFDFDIDVKRRRDSSDQDDNPPLFRGIVYRVTDTPVIANVASVHSDRFLHLATCFTMRTTPECRSQTKRWTGSGRKPSPATRRRSAWPTSGPTAARSAGVHTASSNRSQPTRRPPPGGRQARAEAENPPCGLPELHARRLCGCYDA